MRGRHTHDISVVIPVYNEAENLEPLVRETRCALETVLEYEIVLVDDGSDDESAARLAALEEEARGTVRCVRHDGNYGQSTALWTGVRAAGAAWIVTMDGDLQNDPRDILRLTDRLLETPCNTQMVAGIRRRRMDSWVRRASSRIANRVRGAILKDGVSDTGCGLKLIEREAYLRLPFFDHMHRFLPALIQRGGGRVLAVEVEHRPRTRGESKYGVHNRLWTGIVDLLGVLWLKRRMTIPMIKNEADACRQRSLSTG